jgi:long-subunit acyl-CoA synthetase (AMP-forming)
VFDPQGSILVGGISAGMYITNMAEACRYQANHSEAEVVVVENFEQLKKFKDISAQLPALKVRLAG